MKFTDEQVIHALIEHRGAVYHAAAALGASHDTIYKHIKRSKEVRRALQGARGRMLDTGERKLYSAVEGGEAWAICFYLKTQGKKRGYVERQEMTGKDGEAMRYREEHEPDLSSFTDDELADYRRLNAKAFAKRKGRAAGDLPT